MGTYAVSSKYGRQYLGNTAKREVHDTYRETPQCQIDEIIKAGHAVGFTPDTLEEARRSGYDRCHYCLGGSLR